MNNHHLENSNYTLESIVNLYNSGLLQHKKGYTPKTSGKYLRLLFDNMPTPSLQIEQTQSLRHEGIIDMVCIAENDFLSTMVAYANGSKHKGFPKFCELSEKDRSFLENYFVNVWKIWRKELKQCSIYTNKKEVQDAD